jgi:hypothetical protein
METNLDEGEVVFYNNFPWLVTNKRICSPSGIYQLSDVYDAHTQLGYSIPGCFPFNCWWFHLILEIGGIVLACCFFSGAVIPILLFIVPGYLLSRWTEKYSFWYTSLYINHSTGVINLFNAGLVEKDHEPRKLAEPNEFLNKPGFDFVCAQMKQIQQAILNALASIRPSNLNVPPPHSPAAPHDPQ